ncbi:MAG: toxin-antitoxin system HicB family antitoxin [Candidatus Deferrimicrobiaceae bacterium]
MKYAIVVSYSDEDHGYIATVPEDVRRRLELEAKRNGVSLNRLILQKIA